MHENPDDKGKALWQKRQETRQALIMQGGLGALILLAAADSMPPGTKPLLL